MILWVGREMYLGACIHGSRNDEGSDEKMTAFYRSKS